MYKYNKGRRGRTEFRTWDSQNLLTEVLFDPVHTQSLTCPIATALATHNSLLPTHKYVVELSQQMTVSQKMPQNNTQGHQIFIKDGVRGRAPCLKDVEVAYTFLF